MKITNFSAEYYAEIDEPVKRALEKLVKAPCYLPKDTNRFQRELADIVESIRKFPEKYLETKNFWNGDDNFRHVSNSSKHGNRNDKGCGNRTDSVRTEVSILYQVIKGTPSSPPLYRFIRNTLIAKYTDGKEFDVIDEAMRRQKKLKNYMLDNNNLIDRGVVDIVPKSDLPFCHFVYLNYDKELEGFVNKHSVDGFLHFNIKLVQQKNDGSYTPFLLNPNSKLEIMVLFMKDNEIKQVFTFPWGGESISIKPKLYECCPNLKIITEALPYVKFKILEKESMLETISVN